MGSGTSLEYCELTDIGRRRLTNQDAKAVVPPWSPEQYRRRGWLFVVADGMGAHAAGEMASALAVEHVPLLYEKLASRSPPLALRSSIEQANAEIHARGENAADMKGMGTTCTALAIVPRGALVGHVGDSRAYRVRGSTIDQFSRDHSLAWEMEARRPAGASAGAEESVPRNIITRSLGPHPTVTVDLEGPFPVERGDVFVLCSDGLSGQVADEEIGLLAGCLAPPRAAAALVGLALVRGAPDNVTVIVARAGEKEVSQDAEAAAWPLAGESVAADAPRPVPWGLLALAAASLLGALVGYGALRSAAVRESLPQGIADALAVAVAGVSSLLFIASLVAALAASRDSAEREVRTLRPGATIGAGPYRSHGCGPTAERFEGIVASVESAADGLAAADRDRLLQTVARARAAVAEGDVTRAIESTAGALSSYRHAVEAARTEGLSRG